MRLNGCEYGLDDGITIDETVATAQIAEAAGADAIHISAQAANPFRDFTLGPLPAEIGQYREMAAAVKRGVSIPVIAVGRLLRLILRCRCAGFCAAFGYPIGVHGMPKEKQQAVSFGGSCPYHIK